MKLLLDTHILLWFLMNPEKLPETAMELLQQENIEIFYSTASIWEVTIKHMAKPEGMKISGRELADMCRQAGFSKMNITDEHVHMLETLRRPEKAPRHNDPFDRMLISQAKSANIKLVTHDSLIPDYGEPCVLSV